MQHVDTGHDEHDELRGRIRSFVAGYGNEYFAKCARAGEYPEQFVDDLTKAGWLAALIPEQYGGQGLGLAEASVIMEEINRGGGNSGDCHGQMYNMGTLLRHGSDAQKEQYLPKIAAGELRLQTMAVTEPETGTETTKTRTTAEKKGDRYVINGEKVWIGRIQYSDLMILLARTTPVDQVEKRSRGLSIFLVDLHHALQNGMTATRIPNMVDAVTNEVTFDNLEIPADALIGEEDHGLKYIFSGLNAERTLIAAECIGDGYWFLDHAAERAREREVFDRAIGANQGIQFPMAEAYMSVRAADLMRYQACALFDDNADCGAEANMAKHLAAKASWEAANMCVQTYGGYAFDERYHVERKFRQTRLYQVAPISTNLILSYVSQNLLGLPRSF
ncbi:acyl-CoA dehydrogenase family protein [uncultured Salinisphaera sp.]|uniref:acyl-CoA dehydrogenase family protein n=1 Tax=uncultured Salinisphaera sp. TaxID=359372 RepID=UPI0032B251F0|tara:strand:- start:909 stop:2078 length:1170 start_codon:yes stop_codon:yes gene_type:complete